MNQPAAEEWWQSLYDEIVAEVFLVRKDPDEVRATVAFLLDRLAVRPGDAVFDQCCGIGSLSLPMARAGVAVIGVDQCAAYVRRAQEEATRDRLPCEYHVGDAFAFTPATPVAAVVNWGTSFGNADDAGNLQMLRRAYEALRPGGWLALDYQHVPRVLRTFQPAMVHRHGETMLVRESSLDWNQGTLRQRWTILHGDGSRDLRYSTIRLYLPHELGALVRASGFVEEAYHGGVRGEPLTLDSPRCILVARRPG